MKKVALHNLGCKVNSYEIEVMQENLEKNGYKVDYKFTGLSIDPERETE